MHSDNGTNFVGAERMLREAIKQLHAYKELRPFFKDKGIDWTFSPAGTPHFDDAHESYRALEKEDKTLHHPTDDMFRMILIEIAGLKNSRDKWNTNYLQSLATGKKWQTDKSLPRGHWNIVTSRRSSPEKTDLCG